MVLLAYRGTPGLCAVRKRSGGKGEGNRGKREERRGKGDDEKERWEGGRRRGEGKEEIKTVYVL